MKKALRSARFAVIKRSGNNRLTPVHKKVFTMPILLCIYVFFFCKHTPKEQGISDAGKKVDPAGLP